MAGLSDILTAIQNGVVAVNNLSQQTKTIFSNLWANKRLAISAAYQVANTDKAQTIALGGTALYTLSLAAPSNYDSNFYVWVLNEDTTRAKAIAATGLSTFLLWPGQSCLIFNQNNVWHASPEFQRWKAPSGTTIYADELNGSDGNDGLAPFVTSSNGPVATLQQAVMGYPQTLWDLSGSAPQITVQLAANGSSGVPTASGYHLHYSGPAVGAQGRSTVVITGGSSAPTSFICKGNAGGGAIELFDNARARIQNLTILGSSLNNGLLCSDLSQARINNLTFGSAGGTTNQAQMWAEYASQIILEGACTISGGAAWMMFAQKDGGIDTQGLTVTISTAVTYTQQTVSLADMAWVEASGTTWTGSSQVTGTKYFISGLSLLNTGVGSSTTIPGSTNAAAANTGAFAN